MTQIFHNPNCSKSRSALEWLLTKGENPHIIDYRANPPSFAELKDLLQKLDLPAQAILRQGEASLSEHYPQLDLADEDAVLHAIHRHPILLERPIIVRGQKAVIGRPLGNVQKLFP